MFRLIAVMLLGAGIGFLFRHSRKAASFSGKAVFAAICAMLLLLGASAGSDPDVVSGLPVLGLQAMILASAGIAGSVLLAWAVYVFIYRRNGK